jgi:hypothetical protein
MSNPKYKPSVAALTKTVQEASYWSWYDELVHFDNAPARIAEGVVANRETIRATSVSQRGACDAQELKRTCLF